MIYRWFSAASAAAYPLCPHRQFRAFSVRSADIRLRHCLAVTKPLKKHIRNSLYRQSPFGRCPRNRRSNMRNSYLFTSESVSEGHPDKVSDQISDAVVDLFLSKDPEARVACETLTTTNRIVLAGEVRCSDRSFIAENGELTAAGKAEIEKAARDTVKRIGYEQESFHWETAELSNYIHGQSAHIAQGVDASGNKEEGPDDQGILFVHASHQTPDLMPATQYYRSEENTSELQSLMRISSAVFCLKTKRI